MTFRTLEDDITIMLPEDFDLEANLGYLTREKNECMYEIEDGFITKAIAIEKARFLIQISVIANKQMVIRFWMPPNLLRSGIGRRLSNIFANGLILIEI